MNLNSLILKDTKTLLHCEASSVATEHAVTVKEKWKGSWRSEWRRGVEGEAAAWGKQWCEMRMAVALVVMVVMEGEGAGVGY